MRIQGDMCVENSVTTFNNCSLLNFSYVIIQVNWLVSDLSQHRRRKLNISIACEQAPGLEERKGAEQREGEPARKS